MIKTLLLLIAVLSLTVSCASSPERRNKIITQATEHIQPTRNKLSTYSNFDLKPMKFIEAISSNTKKL